VCDIPACRVGFSGTAWGLNGVTIKGCKEMIKLMGMEREREMER
jgi:hypothetical protein